MILKTPIINVIIVDDQSMFVSGMRLLLGKFGISTTATASNGQEALVVIRKKKPHVLLLDLEMPVLNGSKTLDNITQRFPDIKVIIVSAYHDEELIKDCLNRGARAFISKKECNENDLIAAVRGVYQFGFYRENLPKLFSNPAVKDRHYFKLIFTAREQEIIVPVCEGRSTNSIAAELCISEKAVEGHLTEIFKKVKVENKYQFLVYARDHGLQFLGKPRIPQGNPYPVN